MLYSVYSTRAKINIYLKKCFGERMWPLSGFTLSWCSTDLKETLITHAHKFLMTFVFTEWMYHLLKMTPPEATGRDSNNSLIWGFYEKLHPSIHHSCLHLEVSTCPWCLSCSSLCHVHTRTLRRHFISTLNYEHFGEFACSFRCIYILCFSAMYFVSNLFFFFKSTLSINLTSLDTQYWVH